MKERWRYSWSLNAWLGPDVLEWLLTGDPVQFEFEGLGYVLRWREPPIVYSLIPPSLARN